MNAYQRDIIAKAQEILEEDDRVLAAWLEGSIARKEADDYSDVDLWVCTKDNAFEDFIEDREQFAAQVGPVASMLYPKTQHEHEDLDSFQIIFEDQPGSLTLDVDVQKRSRKFSFMKDSRAEECEVLFDRAKIVHWKHFRIQEIETKAEEVFDDIVVRFWHGVPKVQKHLAREDLLEAIDVYMDRLNELVMLYRILYIPEKVEWGMKDVEYDLPEDVVHILYDLMPYPSEKAVSKLLKKMAKTFLKASRITGRRIHHEVPELLAKQVLNEL